MATIYLMSVRCRIIAAKNESSFKRYGEVYLETLSAFPRHDLLPRLAKESLLLVVVGRIFVLYSLSKCIKVLFITNIKVLTLFLIGLHHQILQAENLFDW